MLPRRYTVPSIVNNPAEEDPNAYCQASLSALARAREAAVREDQAVLRSARDFKPKAAPTGSVWKAAPTTTKSTLVGKDSETAWPSLESAPAVPRVQRPVKPKTVATPAAVDEPAEDDIWGAPPGLRSSQQVTVAQAHIDNSNDIQEDTASDDDSLDPWGMKGKPHIPVPSLLSDRPPGLRASQDAQTQARLKANIIGTRDPAAGPQWWAEAAANTTGIPASADTTKQHEESLAERSETSMDLDPWKMTWTLPATGPLRTIPAHLTAPAKPVSMSFDWATPPASSGNSGHRANDWAAPPLGDRLPPGLGVSAMSGREDNDSHQFLRSVFPNANVSFRPPPGPSGQQVSWDRPSTQATTSWQFQDTPMFSNGASNTSGGPWGNSVSGGFPTSAPRQQTSSTEAWQSYLNRGKQDEADAAPTQNPVRPVQPQFAPPSSYSQEALYRQQQLLFAQQQRNLNTSGMAPEGGLRSAQTASSVFPPNQSNWNSQPPQHRPMGSVGLFTPANNASLFGRAHDPQGQQTMGFRLGGPVTGSHSNYPTHQGNGYPPPHQQGK